MKRYRRLLIVLLTIFIIIGGVSIIFNLINDYPIKYILSEIEWNNSISLLFIVISIILIWLQIKMIRNKYRTSFFQGWIFCFMMSLYVLSRYQNLLKPFESFVNIPTIPWTWHYFFEQSRLGGDWYSFIFDVKLVDVICLSVLFPIYKLSFLGYSKIKPYVQSLFAIIMIVSSIRKPLKSIFERISYYIKYRFVVDEISVFKRKVIGYLRDEYAKNLKIISKESNEDNNLFFEEDNIIEVSSNKYVQISKILVSKLIRQKFQNAFSIGLIGPWGNGKTSFVSHFLKEYKKEAGKKQIEIIKFYPAHSHNSVQILSDFLGLLAFQLKKYDGRLSQTILSYAAKLLEVGLNGTKNFQSLLKSDNWFFQNKPSYKVYEELREVFKKLDIQIMIIIDDVDRLNKDEIIELLRIIRNTANFPNMVFVVAYDKDYVIKTIEKPIEYLEKYFQYELFIPPHRKEDLIKAFSEIVLRKFPSDTSLVHAMQEKVLNQTMLMKSVRNYRDVKVLSNAFCVNIEFLSGDVDYIDLLHFTLMNRCFPTELRHVYDNFSEIFTSEVDKIEGLRTYDRLVLHQKGCEDNTNEKCLEKLISKMNINDDRKDLFIFMFKFLFSVKNDTPAAPMPSLYLDELLYLGHVYIINNELSIVNIEKTHLFFELVLRNDDISNVEFPLKIQLELFKEYYTGLIESSSKPNEKAIYEKLLSLNKLLYNKQVLENVIFICNDVRGFKDVSLIDVLLPFIRNQTEAREVFDNKNSEYEAFFNERLWANKEINIEYRINTLLDLLGEVSNIETFKIDGYTMDSSIAYLGVDKIKIKGILVSLTKELISIGYPFGLRILKCISKILDCDLGVQDKDIELSNYICSDKKILKDYLRVVITGYENGFSYSSAIFKVFADKDYLKSKSFKWSKDIPQIYEFYHLLELHEIREDDLNLNGFTPFYFKDNRDKLKSDPIQSIYIKKKKNFYINTVTDITHPEFNIEVYWVKDSIYIIEGQHSYLKLIEKMIPETGVHGYVKYLRDNIDKFEILSIQCPQEIDKSLYPLVGNYKVADASVE